MIAEQRAAVLIYQMGKVGSTTIDASLEQAELALSIYKAHFLSDEGIAHGEKFHQETLKVPWHETPHIQTSQHIREQIRSDDSINWKIITLVREPISREISEFFQYFHSMYPELLDDAGNIVNEARALRILQTKFMFYNPETNYTCRWFDMEMRNMFGLDVYAYPFDHDSGYTVVQQGNIDLLMLRLENLNETMGDAIGRFLNLPTPLKMVKANQRSEQQRGHLYRKVIQEFAISESLCRKIYGSRYAQHFYSPTEIERLIKRWTQQEVHPLS